MRLNLEIPGVAATPIAEEDPLPPVDRVAPQDMIDGLYRTQAPRLLRSMRRRTSSDHARDIVQQVFARLTALGRRRSNEIRAPIPYLYATAENLLRDDARAANRTARNLHVSDDLAGLVGTDQIAALEARDMLNRLEDAMRRLKPRTREIFMAHRLDGYTYREIATRTGLGVKCIEKHMTLALAHLDRCLPDR